MATCDRCGREVALAKICPYCGKKITQPAESRKGKERREQKADDGSGFVESFGPEDNFSPSAFGWIRTFFAYMGAKDVSLLRKLAMGALAFYIVYPLDLIVDFLPVLGWIDDAAAIALLWRYISGELRAYYREHPSLFRR